MDYDNAGRVLVSLLTNFDEDNIGQFFNQTLNEYNASGDLIKESKATATNQTTPLTLNTLENIIDSNGNISSILKTNNNNGVTTVNKTSFTFEEFSDVKVPNIKNAGIAGGAFNPLMALPFILLVLYRRKQRSFIKN